MIITQFYPFYELLSLISTVDLLKLILVYSNAHHDPLFSQSEEQKNSQKIIYTAALIALFSKTDSEQDILYQTKQLLIGIRQELLYETQFEALISTLEKVTLLSSPWSHHWPHRLKRYPYPVALEHSNTPSETEIQDSNSRINTINFSEFFAAIAELTQKHFTEQGISFSIWKRKQDFFYSNPNRCLDIDEPAQRKEIRRLVPYFNKEEVERVKKIALAQLRYCFDAYSTKGLRFLIAIFYRLSEKQCAEIKSFVLSITTRWLDGNVTLDGLWPLYDLLVLLAPTFNSVEIATIPVFLRQTIMRYHSLSCSGRDLLYPHDPLYPSRSAPNKLIKILLGKMPIQALYETLCMSSIYSESPIQNYTILSLFDQNISNRWALSVLSQFAPNFLSPFVLHLKKSTQIQTLKTECLNYYKKHAQLENNALTLLTQIAPHCTEEEYMVLNHCLSKISDKNHHYLRLIYALFHQHPHGHDLCANHKLYWHGELNTLLIQNIHHFDSDFDSTDIVIFNTLLPTFTEDQITHIIHNMLSAYYLAMHAKKHPLHYSKAKEHVFKIISPRLTKAHINWTSMTLLFCIDQFPNAKMQFQALNIMCLLISSHHAIPDPSKIKTLPSTLTYNLLKPFFQEPHSQKEAPVLTDFEQQAAIILRQLSTYIQRIESTKIEYWQESIKKWQQRKWPTNEHSAVDHEINFRHKFWLAPKRRSNNRVNNYRLALALWKKILAYPHEALETIFSETSLQAMKNEIQPQEWPINTSLNKIISYAQHADRSLAQLS